PERRAAADDVEGPTPVRLDQTPEKLIRIRHRKVALPWVQDDAAPPLGSRAMLRGEVDTMFAGRSDLGPLVAMLAGDRRGLVRSDGAPVLAPPASAAASRTKAGAAGGSRTHTSFRTIEFESIVFSSYTTAAGVIRDTQRPAFQTTTSSHAIILANACSRCGRKTTL